MSKAAKPEKTESLLVDTAKAIGSAAGKLAAMAGVSEPVLAGGSGKKTGKLEKKTRARVPRKEKKLRNKAAAHA